MSTTADHNLLIGVIALQMEFITRDQLINALSAWVLEKSTSLEELLLKHHFVDAETQQILVSLVNKHLQLHGGDAQESLNALGKPFDVQELELESLDDADLNVSVASIGTYVSSKTDVAPKDDIDPTMTLGHESAEGGRFQPLRPHAKGGLGEVWVALDKELQREVALKEIQAQYADHEENRARFVVEAEITGALEHPGIVPVYGLGAYEDGRPYYAMRMIHGKSLRDATDHFFEEDKKKKWGRSQRSLELRKLLGQFVDMCNALEYAHSRGIIHRDLKPQNVMLGQFGETMVVDWGLAKPVDTEHESLTEESKIEPKSSAVTNPTIIGRAVGTPAYMSPEQAAGKHQSIGPATDVYGLGSTLYYILTGDAPFSDTDTGSMLRSVVEGDFPSPRDKRSGVPKPLEAICLKAMARKPEDRYASPKAMAEDVERALGGQPPLAWNEPLLTKAGRWIRTHYKVAVPSAAALLVVSLVIAYTLMDRAQRDESIRRQVDILMSEARRTIEAGEEEAGMRMMSLASGVSSSSSTFADETREIEEELSQRAMIHDFKKAAQEVASNGISTSVTSDRFAPIQSIDDVVGASGGVDVIVSECNSALRILGIGPDDDWREVLRTKEFNDEQIEEVSSLVSQLYLIKALRALIRGRRDPGSAESAIAALDEAEDADEARVGIYLLRMLLYRQIDEDEKADAAGERFSELGMQPDLYTTLDYYLLGTVTHNLIKDPAEAVGLYQQVLAQKPDHYGAAFGLYDCQYQLGRNEEAIDALNVCIALRPKVGELYLFRGFALFETQEYELARLNFERGCELVPTYGFMHYFKGRSEIMLEKWGDAVDSFSTALESDIQLTNRISWLALSRAHVPEQYRETIADIEKSLSLDDVSGDDRWRCARAYALCSRSALEMGDDQDLANECVAKSVELLRQGLMDGSIEPIQLTSGDLVAIKETELYLKLVEEFPAGG